MTNKDHLRDLLSLCAEIISKYNKELSHVEDSELQLWDNFIDRVDAASAAYGMSHALNDPNRCHKCGSTDWDYANVGIEYAVQCTDCEGIYSIVPEPETPKKPWVEITKGQIDYATRQSDNYYFAWEIEAICKSNNGY